MRTKSSRKPYQVDFWRPSPRAALTGCFAPVEYAALACKLSDETDLPMTVHTTTDPDMPFIVLEFTRGSQYAPPVVSKPYDSLPLVTYLPSRYNVR